jgi:hypothetical protein
VGAVRFQRFRKPCTVEPVACHEISETSMTKIGMRSYIVEKNIPGLMWK